MGLWAITMPTTMPIPERPEWQAQAACRGANIRLFYPDIPGGPGYRHAKAICRECPVSGPCLAAALDEEADYRLGIFGMRGGLTPTERLAIIKNAQAEAGKPPRRHS